MTILLDEVNILLINNGEIITHTYSWFQRKSSGFRIVIDLRQLNQYFGCPHRQVESCFTIQAQLWQEEFSWTGQSVVILINLSVPSTMLQVQYCHDPVANFLEPVASHLMARAFSCISMSMTGSSQVLLGRWLQPSQQ